MRQLFYILLLLFPFTANAQTAHITTPHDTVCGGSSVHFNAVVTGVTIRHYRWLVNNAPYGTDSAGYTTNTLVNGDTVMCEATNAAGDTILATSNKIGMTMEVTPVVMPITGTDTNVCVGASIILSDATTGGIWDQSNAHASVLNGVVKGMAAGNTFEYHTSTATDSIYYTVTNSCRSARVSKVITIYPILVADFYLDNSFCVGGGSYLEGNFGHLVSSTGNVSIDADRIYGLHAGNDYIYNIVTNICGSDTFGQSIVVYPLPVIDSILPSNTVICSGDSIRLNTASNALNRWSSKHQLVSIDSNNILTGIDPGTDTIYLSAYNSCGAAYKAAYVSVLPPGHIIACDSIWVNDFLTLYDTTNDGIWNISDPNVASVDQTGILTPKTPGSTIIEYSLGSCTAKKKITITSTQLISGSNNLCEKATTVFTVTGKGTWQNSDSSVAIIDTNGKIRAFQPGNTVVTHISKSGCNIGKKVTVHPLPEKSTGDRDIFYGARTQLYNNTPGGTWSSNNMNAIIDSNSGVVYGNLLGEAIITYTLATGCYDTLAAKVEFTRHNMVIYPNPAKTEIIIYAYTDLYKRFSIIDNIGRELIRKDLDGPLTKVNVQSLKKGVYYVHLKGNKEETLVLPIVKE